MNTDKKENNRTINIRVSKEFDETITNKAKELGISKTEVLKIGAHVTGETKTMKERIGILVENQERFNILLPLLEKYNAPQDVKDLTVEILKGEQKVWQL